MSNPNNLNVGMMCIKYMLFVINLMFVVSVFFNIFDYFSNKGKFHNFLEQLQIK